MGNALHTNRHRITTTSATPDCQVQALEPNRASGDIHQSNGRENVLVRCATTIFGSAIEHVLVYCPCATCQVRQVGIMLGEMRYDNFCERRRRCLRVSPLRHMPFFIEPDHVKHGITLIPNVLALGLTW